jgi:hypothetical protein
MSTPRLLFFVAVAASLIGSIGLAQVTARQGAPAATEFRSPMVLEVPLPDMSHLSPGTGKAFNRDIENYRCEGISLHSLTVRVKDRPRKSDTGTVTLEINGAVSIPPSNDRLVDIRFVAKKAEAILGTTSVTKLDAEEDRTTKFRATLRLDQARLIDAFSSDPHPSLEVTVTVSNNS